MMYENLAWLIVGICIGILVSLIMICGNHIVVTEADISFLIKDFMGYKDVHLIQITNT
jgi:hypothetical protein